MTTFTAEQLITDEGAPRVRFAARERRGVFLGLTFLQLVVVGGGIAILLATLFINPNALWVMLPVTALVLFFALARLGACNIPVNLHLRGEGLHYILEHSQCTCLIAEGELDEVLRPIIAHCGIGTVFWRQGTKAGGRAGSTMDMRHAEGGMLPRSSFRSRRK